MFYLAGVETFWLLALNIHTFILAAGVYPPITNPLNIAIATALVRWSSHFRQTDRFFRCRHTLEGFG